MSLPYIINVAIVLAACLAFYKVLLRRETFYKMNRWTLLVCIGVAFTLPLAKIPADLSFRRTVPEVPKVPDVPEVGSFTVPNGTTLAETPANSNTIGTEQSNSDLAQLSNPKSKIQNPKSSPVSYENYVAPALSHSDEVKRPGLTFAQVFNWMIIIYWFGVALFAASFLFQLIVLILCSLKQPIKRDGPYRIKILMGNKAACSFGNTIFINPLLYDEETFKQIILHEKVHIRQRHTVDILLAELLLIFQWFNPFAWIYRREVENNLEFLTDDQLTHKENVNKQRYQLSLLKVSAPHFPLSLTNNYNQSTLKKRIAMMNTKKSSLRTGWKYFFLIPVLALVAALVNEPIAQKLDDKNTANSQNAQLEQMHAKAEELHKLKGENESLHFLNQLNVNDNHTLVANNWMSFLNAAGCADQLMNAGRESEGYWFAVIKGETVNIQFSDEKIEKDTDFESGHMRRGQSWNGTTFKLADLGNLPRGTEGTFYITREAGKLEMTGKFDGNTGMGKYKFIADKEYFSYMNKELGETLDEDDQLAFFFVNIKKSLLTSLKAEGFTGIDKDELIPVAALGIDQAYIRSIRDAGFKDVSLEDLVPLKALGVDAKYIAEMKSVVKDLDADELVGYKAQGITKEEVEQFRKTRGDKKGKDNDEDDVDELISFKAMGIDEAYINSFKSAGIDIDNEQLISYKALGITPDYIKSWEKAGYKIDPDEMPGIKSMGVTPEFIKQFTDMGFKNVEPEEIVAFKALGITPDYIKSFQSMGYKNIDLDEYPALKSQNITPEIVKSYEALGFKNMDLNDVVGARATGVTPEWIKEMRGKGFNYDRLHKYVTLKTLDED